MPIIKDGNQAREIINKISESGKSIPCFCTESVYTTEAIFKGAKVFKETKNIKGKLPVIIAFTASYEDRQQLKNYTGLSDFREGILAVKADIERLLRDDGPYNDLDVIVHLDHAQPGNDNWIVEEYSDFISSVMWDCSHYSLKDNIKMMQEFVGKYKNNFVIEGAVDEIYNYSTDNTKGEVIDNITDANTAERYYNETGVDLIVANLGTEHRRTEGTVEYHGKEARDISSKLGRHLVLHGTSSLKEDELQNLPKDGIVKVNLWGNLESVPGKLLAEEIIKNIKNILSKDQINNLIETGFLNEKLKDIEAKPSIKYLTEKYRRDSIYNPTATEIITRFFNILYME